MIFILYFITVLSSSLAIDNVGSGINKMSCVLLESYLEFTMRTLTCWEMGP